MTPSESEADARLGVAIAALRKITDKTAVSSPMGSMHLAGKLFQLKEDQAIAQAALDAIGDVATKAGSISSGPAPQTHDVSGYDGEHGQSPPRPGHGTVSGQRTLRAATDALPVGARVRFIKKIGELPQDGWTIAKQPLDACSLYVVKHDSGGELCMRAEDMERLAVETGSMSDAREIMDHELYLIEQWRRENERRRAQ